MKKRVISLLLTLVMLLGMIPAVSAAPAAETKAQDITIDFGATVKEMAQQDWWDELPQLKTASGYDVRRIGESYQVKMTDTQVAAYDEMLLWMEKNSPWTISDAMAADYKSSGGKRLYLCADDASPWAIDHLPYFYNRENGSSDLMLDITADAAGEYQLLLDAYFQSTGDTHNPVDTATDPGGGYADVYLNGELVLDDVCFRTDKYQDYSATISFGMVELNEGVNTLMIRTTDNVHHIAATGYAARANVYLNGITFHVPENVELRENSSTSIDLLEGFLHHKTVIGETYCVVSSDDDVADAVLNEDGTLDISAHVAGEAELTIYDGETALCTVPVIVSAPSAPKAGTEPVVVDFMAFAKAAVHQDWYEELEDTDYADIKVIGKRYGTAMTSEEYDLFQTVRSYLDENANWNIVDGDTSFKSSGNGRRIFINNGTDAYGVRFYGDLIGRGDDRGSFIISVDVEEEGLYTMDLDLLNEATTSKVKGVGGTTGGGVGRIYVNGQMICSEYQFFANHGTIDWIETVDFGNVYLNKGENEIEIEIFTARNYNPNNGRRAVNLRAMTFTPAKAEESGTVVKCDLSSAWNDANGAATINGGIGAEKTFAFVVEETGWYRPEVQIIRNLTGGMVSVYADENYLGTVNTYGRTEFSADDQLRYVFLEAGSHELSVVITDKTANIAEPRALISAATFTSVEEPDFSVSAKGFSGKRGRVLESTVLGFWGNGMGDSLVNAEFTVEVSDEELVEASVIPATLTSDAVLQVIGLQPGKGEVTVTVMQNGARACVTVPVSFTDYVALETFDVTIPGAVQNQIPRNALQDIVYNMTGADGDVLYPSEANITYEISDDTVLSVDEENHTILGLQNGEVTLTITAEQGGVSFTKSFDLVVADAGVNLFDAESSTFDGGTSGLWTGLQGKDVTNAMAWTEIADDGTGNYAIRMTVNSEVTSKTGKSTELSLPNGKLMQIQPGHLYEMSFRVKMENYVKPEGASWDWILNLQEQDLPTNANGTNINEYYASGKIFGHELVNGEDYVTVVVPVRAPIGEIDGNVFIRPRLTFGPNTGYYPNDAYVSGWQGTFWLDDFQLREVGFGYVETQLNKALTTVGTPSTMTLVPRTTTGSQIALDTDAYKLVVDGAVSTNEDVVIVGSKVGKTNLGDYYRNWDYPNLQVELVGLNAPAQVVTTMTLGDLTARGALEVNPTDLPNILRDIVYKLDGSASAVIARGVTAVGNLEGRTTQLDIIDEETLRSEGAYFISTNPKIASVDAVTGDVTGVNEGATTVAAYVILDGVTRKIEATVTVTDDTDLVSVDAVCPVDFVGTGNLLQLYTRGKKASGGAADMSLYPVAWSVDSDIATITEDGMLYARETGTVTVTASVSVNGKLLTASKTIEVIDNSELPGENLFFDFQFGKAQIMLAGTVEENGIELNREETYLGGEELITNAAGLQGTVPKGESMAFDIQVRKSGWYMVEMVGGWYYAGPMGRGIIDGKYVGSIEFGKTAGVTQYDNTGGYNTVWLDAGLHTFYVTSDVASKGVQVLGGIRFYAVPTPDPMEIEFAAEKTAMVIGETQELTLAITDANDRYFGPLQVTDAPDYTNYYILSSSDSGVVSVSGMTMTAKAPGTATITARLNINGEEVIKELVVTVTGGTIADVELTAEDTTVRPNAEPFALSVLTYDAAGAQVELAENDTVRYESLDTDILTVSDDGIVTLTGALGSAQVKAIVTENGREIEASLWFTVTQGKTDFSVFTEAERANARANVLKYDWAWQEKEAAVKKADYYVEHLDLIYNMWIREGIPRNGRVGYQKDESNYRLCHYCGVDLVGLFSHYPWSVDPIENPWKVTCPICKRDFPSNDFESYYKSGLDENGYFHAENADPQFLVNELYPEMGEGWGVDDGFGYVTGNVDSAGVDEVHTYIAYYMLAMIDGLGESKHDMFTILTSLVDAYLYTGDEKYGNAGAILTDRLAEIYPDYWTGLYEPLSRWALSDGDSGRGKLSGQIWDGAYGKEFAEAYDAFFDCYDNEAVVEYLRDHADFKCEDPEDITPDSIRKNVEDNLILEYFRAHKGWHAQGNFAMGQSSLASCAVAIDRLPESKEIIDHLFATSVTGKENGAFFNTGGDMLRILIEEVCRDGIGGEGSFQYNGIWTRDSLQVANTLSGFDLVDYADLWKNQKFRNLHLGMMRLTVCGHLLPQYGEAGYIQTEYSGANLDQALDAYLATEDPEYAKVIYALNGNSVEGLHGDIFHSNPERIKTDILNIIRTNGQWNMSESDLLAGHGMAILRKGPETYIAGVNDDQFSDYNIFFGYTNTSHAQREQLRFDVDAFGLNLSGSMGYPLNVTGSDAMRMQWIRGTVSDNNVLVNDKCQSAVDEGGFPLHFADDGYAKVMDVEAENAYEDADIYRRTVVTVEGCDGVDYAVDFFRVLGGSEHVYSFHGATDIDPVTEGLDMVEQPFGTYAGADVKFGYDGVLSDSADAISGNGYNWLRNVSRDNAPETTFSVDWAIKDFHHRLSTSAGIHLKLTMLSEEPMTEVALAEGQPPQDGRNPEHLEYVLVRRSGEEGMDTLFTAVVEPYQHESYIASSELVSVELVEGTENAHDRVAAVKVTQKTGRVDYVIYATNANCTYRIDKLFTFCGFAGVVSYEGGQIVYAWGSEATTVADVIENANASVAGTVTDFTKGITMDGYFLTVELDEEVSAETLKGRYIYINNDGWENAVYPICDVELSGTTAVLNLGDKTLVREYIDELDYDKGYKHNIAEGQTFSIPLSATFDAASFFTYTADTIVKAGTKLTLTTGVSGAGVTYEAEGLPSGAKFTASNGTITWTTSRTQTGRYPVTVKAIDADGTVLGTMSFVIYVVSYTGSTYDASACAHSKAVTYTVDGVIETVCPACGTITKTAVEEEPAIQKFDMAGSNMTLGNELKMNYLVETSKLGDGTYTAKITHGDTVVEETFRKYSSVYSCVSYILNASQMADTITVEVFDEDGNAVSNVYTTSVRTYVMNVLQKSTTAAKSKTLMVDMLNYGAAAQEYFSYNTADLANSVLTEAQKACATGEVTCTDQSEKGENYFGSNLSLNEKILLNLYFKNVTSDMYAEITFTDFYGVAHAIEVPFEEFRQYSGSTYAVIVDDIVLADCFVPVTVTVYNADGSVHGSATDSVESYCARKNADGSNALYSSIMKFATSAQAYFS